MKSPSRFTPALRACAIAGAALLCAVSASADEGLSRLSWESDWEAAVIGTSHLHGGGGHGRADAFEFGTRDVASYRVQEGLLLRLGIDFHEDSFGISGSPLIPNTLQATSLVIGADVQIGEAWLFRLEVQPGFYSSGWHFGGDDFNAPIILGGSYFVSADLQLVAGLSVNFNRRYPVLPGVGFRWKVSKDWVADFILPTPRLEYSVSKPVTLYIGADLRGDTYRVNGVGGPSKKTRKLEGTVVDYSQVRVGAGLTWKVSGSVTLEAEAGCLPVHEFDYYRADTRVRATNMPAYGTVSLKAAF